MFVYIAVYSIQRCQRQDEPRSDGSSHLQAVDRHQPAHRGKYPKGKRPRLVC